MSPFNPVCAPNQLAQTETLLAQQRARGVDDSVRFIERMNTRNKKQGAQHLGTSGSHHHKGSTGSRQQARSVVLSIYDFAESQAFPR